MAEWIAHCWKSAVKEAHKGLGGELYPKHPPDDVLYNGPEAVELELEAEAWLRKNGIPGQAWVQIIWDGGDGAVHHIVRLLSDRGIELTNTSSARWPIEIPEYGIGGFGDGDDYGDDDDSEGEGEGEMVRRIFGRFFDGKRWRKVSVGDPESMVQRLRLSLGLVDEREAEIYGDSHRRAREEQAMIVWERYKNQPNTRLRIHLPQGLELEKDKSGSWTVMIPDDEIRRRGA